jgi:DNA-binding transcriptional regulator YiaG
MGFGRKKKMKSEWTAERIKTLREKYGESQGDFAKRLHVSVDSVRGWEQGRGDPSGTAQELLRRVEEDLGPVTKSTRQPKEKQPA